MDNSTHNRGLFRYAAFVAADALVLIGSGAYVTSAREATSAANVAATAALSGSGVHQWAGIAVAVLALALAGWVGLADRRGTMRALAAIAVVTVGADAWTGLGSPLPPELAALHASLAPLFFCCVVAIAIFTAPNWNAAPEPVDDRGLHFLRPLAIAAPPLVFLQIVLGALYRHKVTSVFYHMAGAMVVSLVALVACMVVLQQYPAHRRLRGSAIHLMSIVLVQVALGVTAFTMQLLETENTPGLAVFTASHVVVGNLVFGASLMFAVQVQRNVVRGMAQQAAAS